LNVMTAPSLLDTPEMTPAVVFTLSGGIADSEVIASTKNSRQTNLLFIFPPRHRRKNADMNVFSFCGNAN
jgi:hypothetical protein